MAATDPTPNLPDYPDANAKFVKLKLINETGEVFTYESSSVADNVICSDLQLTSDGKIAFIYQAPSGSNFGFKMPYRIWNGNALDLDELIFDNVN